MDNLTPEEVDDWKRMMAETTPTVVSPETFAQLSDALEREPEVLPKLAALMQETPIWDQP